MGEKETCLVTVPPDNEHSKSLEPIPALRESVSFGRYASESLDWGKWSSFCQNKYLEEAEKYSTRGSVAQKKAYFEAHYKRIAAKKAAALLEKENTSSSGDYSASESEKGGRSGQNQCNNSAAADFQFTESNNHLASHDEECVSAELNDEVKVEFELPEAKGGVSVTWDACNIKDTGFINPITFPEDNIQSSPAERGSIPVVNTEKNDHYTYERSARESKPCELLENLDNKNKDIQGEHRNNDNRKKTPLKENCTLNQEISASSDMKKKSTVFKSSFLKRTRKGLPSSPEIRTPASCKKKNSPISSDKTSAKCVKDDKRSTLKNPQMMQSSYKNGEISRHTSKPAPPVEMVRNAGSSFSCFKSLDISNSLRTPIKHSAKGKSKIVQASPLSEKRRRKPLEEGKSESRNAPLTDVNAQLFVTNSRKSEEITSRKSTTSYSTTSTFCFWSKERAEKRKQFMLNIEEKLNARSLEQQAKNKEKAENEFKFLRQSLGFKARPVPDFYRQKEPNEANK